MAFDYRIGSGGCLGTGLARRQRWWMQMIEFPLVIFLVFVFALCSLFPYLLFSLLFINYHAWFSTYCLVLCA